MFPLIVTNVAAAGGTVSKEVDLTNRKVVAISFSPSGTNDEAYLKEGERDVDDDTYNRLVAFDWYYGRYVAFPHPWTPKKKVTVSFKAGGATTQCITFWCL